MAHYNAIGIYTTRSRTWIYTFVSDAGLIRGAIRVNNTLRSAIRWLSNIVVYASAVSFTIPFKALCVGTTRWWIARIYWFRQCCYNIVTTFEWVPSLSCIATAYWTVINNFTSCWQTTSIYAWIDTVLIDTSFSWRAFRTNNTLWSASRWRTLVSFNTSTNCRIIWSFTNTIRSTWRWMARIFRRCSFSFNRLTMCEWVTSVISNTRTTWYMINNVTLCILTTHTRARISALISETSFVPGTFLTAGAFRSTWFIRITTIIW